MKTQFKIFLVISFFSGFTLIYSKDLFLLSLLHLTLGTIDKHLIEIVLSLFFVQVHFSREAITNEIFTSLHYCTI
jgi:hypothetical protein